MIFLKKINPPELLSPAGGKESVYSAVNNGCNAIYLGGKKFNARKYAENFSDEELIEIIDFCHIRNVKVLITINILYKNSEINELLNFVSKMYSAGADAFIVQDIGIFHILKTNFPKIRLHASTQMTAHNIHTVNYLNKMGFSRVVLSRELSLEEIKDICENSSSETEVFIHGALCVSYSGRCLMSSLIGGRSGNRGQCAQPCRLKYSLYKNNRKITENYLLSPKDIMGLNFINKLIKCGVNSFKIEGRMKKPEYVALVTKTYRKYINLSLKGDLSSPSEEDIEKLTQIFNRGGEFSSGYLVNWAGRKMISASPKSSGIKIGIVKSYNKTLKKAVISIFKPIIPGDGIEIWTNDEHHPGTGISKKAKPGDTITLKIKGNIEKGNPVYKSYDKSLNDGLKKDFQNDTKKVEISAYITAKLNSPLKLKLSTQMVSLEVSGADVKSADNAPITKEELIKRLSKTGNTPFKLNFINSECDDNIYIPISEINSLKREALLKLKENITKSYKKENITASYTPPKNKISENKFITVHLNTEEQFLCGLNYDIKRIYFEFNEILIKNYKKFSELCHKNNIEFFACFPIIYRKSFFNEFSEILKNFEKSNIDGYLLRNFQELETQKKTIADYTFNIFNSASVSYMSSAFDEITLSPELTIDELKETASPNSEILVYGKLILMTTHQCPIGLYDGKKETGKFCGLRHNKDNYYLKDRMRAEFPIQTDCLTCTAAILNSVPLCVLNKFNQIPLLPSKHLRVSFTDENEQTADDILYSHTKLLRYNTTDQRINNVMDKLKKTGFTGGYLFRNR